MDTATAQRRGWPGTVLLVLLALVTVNAVYGGVGLMISGLGMPEEWLTNLPVDTWTLPGLALLVTVALPQAAVAWLVLKGHPRAPMAGILAGAGLILWIAVQVVILRRYFFLQPVIAGIGVVEMIVGWLWVKRIARVQPSV